jgi:trk system potassium uptake protein TrkH
MMAAMTLRRFADGRTVVPRHPAQYIVVTFLALILLGTAVLMLPVSTVGRGGAPAVTALFTATSAACVTGLAVVDTSTYWSGFGKVVIVALIQVGGLGIMTLSSLLAVALSRRLGLRQRLVAAAETGSLQLGDLRELLRATLRMTLIVEAVVAVVLASRFRFGHGEPIGRSVVLGVFHAVSAFNNAGFSLFADSLVDYRADLVVVLTLAAAVIAGGLGFPAWRAIAANPGRPRTWDLHTKITAATSASLLAVGTVLFAWFEWTNPATFGPMPTHTSLANGFFHSASTRTAGFHTADVASLNDASTVLTAIFMFIGGGSGSTAGGIKVTTFALLGWVMWAEVRGERDVNVLGRRIPGDLQRQALTVALMAVGGGVAASMVLLALTPFPITDVVFESVSALATVGLSRGITPDLSEPARVVLVVCMFAGRVGPPTLFASMVLRHRGRLYRHPEERVLIG